MNNPTDSCAACTHCVVRVEDVGRGGVVHDDDLVEVATQATQVLDVIPSVEDAGLPEQAAAESAPFVQEVGDGVCVLQRQEEDYMEGSEQFFKPWHPFIGCLMASSTPHNIR